MEFRPAHGMLNFGASDFHRLIPVHLWRINAAEQKDATDQAEGEERSNVKPGLAEYIGVAPETHGFTSASDEPYDTERRRRVRVAELFPPYPQASNKAGTSLGGSLGAVVGSALLSGCTGVQSALDPHGEQADALAALFWTFTAVLGLVWLITMAGLIVALARRRQNSDEPATASPTVERPMAIAFAAMLASSTIVLSGLAVLSFGGQKVLFGNVDGAALTISVIGHQWWWQVRYEGDDSFETANEIRIPVGSPVDVKLTTADVIHSFWIPSLAGKLDLIPGRHNELRIEANKPGIYRGQCAEFCGQQHAHMAIFLVALQPREFERWRASQVAAAKPAANLARHSVGSMEQVETALSEGSE
jgi:cytochrome c oxidase subunit 2